MEEILTEKEYKSEIIAKMERLKVYKPEFDYVIDLLAKTLYLYMVTEKTFLDEGGKLVISYTNRGGKRNKVKNPTWQSMEVLRADILKYSQELGLTPASLKRIKEESLSEDTTDPLVNLLKGLEV